jgi:hypothetical protein
MRPHGREPRPESGFALVLALLALLLLTFMGLTLAATTSQELQSAINYRWSQQALYNAEAGMELGRAALRDMSWGTILPSARTLRWFPAEGGPPPTPSFSTAKRNLERGACDLTGAGAGYGVVLDDGSGPWEFVSTIAGRRLAGAVTLWIRRPLAADDDGTVADDPDSDVLILTAEGIAPYTGAGGMGALRIVEARLRRQPGALGWNVAVERIQHGTVVCR